MSASHLCSPARAASPRRLNEKPLGTQIRKSKTELIKHTEIERIAGEQRVHDCYAFATPLQYGWTGKMWAVSQGLWQAETLSADG
jgi:hypothetical protein